MITFNPKVSFQTVKNNKRLDDFCDNSEKKEIKEEII